MAFGTSTSKVGYYIDFVLVPILVILALIAGVPYHWPHLVGTIAIGFALWTFLEYWIHRVLFHQLYRVKHWVHHRRPASTEVSIPAWFTCLAHGSLYITLLAVCGLEFGTGAFIGLQLGYLSYISTHHAIHHKHLKPFGWLRRRWAAHTLHHQGVEVNFGVVFSFWDRVFGTHQNPRSKLRKGT